MTFGVIGQRGKQPPKTPGQDTLKLTVLGDKLCIALVDDDGKEHGEILVNEFNAWALIGLLSLFVGLKLPKAVMKQIKL